MSTGRVAAMGVAMIRGGSRKLRSGSRMLHMVALAAALASTPAAPRPYPAKPVTLIIPGEPGAGMDTQARVLAAAMASHLGVPVAVENHVGADDAMAMHQVASAVPDGYMLGMASTGLAISPLLRKEVPFDAGEDFSAVSLVSTASLILVGSAYGSASSYGAMMAAAAAGERLSFGVLDCVTRLATEWFRRAIRASSVDIIQYVTGARLTADLRGGHLHAALTPAGVVALLRPVPEIRLLGIAATKRLPALPDLPTLAELGLAGFETGVWLGLVAPAGLAAPIIDRLNAAVRQALEAPAVQLAIEGQLATPAGSTPSEFADLIQREARKWTMVADAAGIGPQDHGPISQ